MAAKPNLTALHKKSSRHRSSLSKAKICGCFYCLREFPFTQIAEWIADNETALCPYCGVDAVLGFKSQPADQELLHAMHEYWFGDHRHLTPEEWKKATDKDLWPSPPRTPAEQK